MLPRRVTLVLARLLIKQQSAMLITSRTLLTRQKLTMMLTTPLLTTIFQKTRGEPSYSIQQRETTK